LKAKECAVRAKPHTTLQPSALQWASLGGDLCSYRRFHLR
jgi:hypothetical protein